MAFSRGDALEVLSRARGAVGYWARPVVLERGENDEIFALALTCDDGVNRVVNVDDVLAVDTASLGEFGDDAGRSVSYATADRAVQLAVFGELRYGVA